MPAGLALTQGPAKYHVGKPKDQKIQPASHELIETTLLQPKKQRNNKNWTRFREHCVLPQDIVGGVNISFYVPTDIYALYWPYESNPQTNGACFRFYNFRRKGNTILNINTIHTNRWRQSRGRQGKHNRNNNNLRAHNWPENETKD